MILIVLTNSKQISWDFKPVWSTENG